MRPNVYTFFCPLCAGAWTLSYTCVRVHACARELIRTLSWNITFDFSVYTILKTALKNCSNEREGHKCPCKLQRNAAVATELLCAKAEGDDKSVRCCSSQGGARLQSHTLELKTYWSPPVVCVFGGTETKRAAGQFITRTCC